MSYDRMPEKSPIFSFEVMALQSVKTKCQKGTFLRLDKNG